MCAIDCASTRSKVLPMKSPLSAPAYGGLTTRPCNMPGKRMSCTNTNSPNTLAGMSTLGKLAPDTVWSCKGLSGVPMSSANSIFKPLSKLPQATAASEAACMPSGHKRNCDSGLPQRCDACCSNHCAACAAAACNGAACTCNEALAIVAPWLGDTSVKPINTCTRDGDIDNSSATICVSAVRKPVPKSTWPCKAVTLPSSHNAMKHSKPSSAWLNTKPGWPGAAGAAGKGERTMRNTPCA